MKYIGVWRFGVLTIVKLCSVHYQRRDGDHPLSAGSDGTSLKQLALTIVLHGLGAIWKHMMNSSNSHNQKEGMADNEPFFQRDVIIMLFAITYFRLNFVE